MAPDHSDARQALIEALIATGHQDQAAFTQVYRLTSTKLFGICLSICGQRAAAEDVLQEVYALVWKNAGGFEIGRASPITWLATIARNRAIDWRRANPSRASANVDEIEFIPDLSPGAEEHIISDEEDCRLSICLAQLQEAHREAIRAAFFGGLTYSDLAYKMNVPLGTVKSWIRRGLGSLRNCLDDGV